VAIQDFFSGGAVRSQAVIDEQLPASQIVTGMYSQSNSYFLHNYIISLAYKIITVIFVCQKLASYST
jgi:hypothetical protein